MTDGGPTKILFPELHEMAKKPMDWEDRCKKLQLIIEQQEKDLTQCREANAKIQGWLSEIEDIIDKRWE